MLRKAQLRLLDMAIYLQETAKKIGVPCRLGWGKCVRGNAPWRFIPWDDDIDMVVDYKDFKRLCDYLRRIHTLNSSYKTTTRTLVSIRNGLVCVI